MVCKNFNHSVNCPSYRNNALKGASAVNQQQQQKQFVFNQQEVNILDKSLKVCQFYITKHKNQYQNNPQDILNELSTSINILSARKNNKSNLKGASQICNETKIQSLKNLLKQYNLI